MTECEEIAIDIASELPRLGITPPKTMQEARDIVRGMMVHDSTETVIDNTAEALLLIVRARQ